MCFSAGASFGGSAVLTVIGIAAVGEAQKPSQLPFALIPLLFAIQQVAEGFVWLSLSHSAHLPWEKPAVYIFLAFAQVVWPVWVPFSIISLEKTHRRKIILYLLLGCGIAVASYLTFALLKLPVSAAIVEHHISYLIGIPDYLTIVLAVLYFISTIIPMFVSRNRNIWVLGCAVFVSFLITQIFYERYVISVWCFFASIISIVIYGILWEMRGHTNLKASRTHSRKRYVTH